MRIRTVKPEFWHDEKIGKLKRECRLLFIGLWNLSDDQGACKSNPVYIKSSLFPYDNDLRTETLVAWLADLQEARMIIPFTFSGEGYFVIRTFHDHQVINRPSKSKWPKGYLQDLLNPEGVITEDSRNTHGALTTGREGKGREKEGNGEAQPAHDQPDKWKTKPKAADVADIPLQNIKAIIERLVIAKNITLEEHAVKKLWKVFKVENLTGEKYYKSLEEVYRHFSNWCATQRIDAKTSSKQPPSTVIDQYQKDLERHGAK